jgi:hypothetical protein
MKDYPLGGTLVFTPDDGVEVGFKPAPITKADARQIGLDFCEASEPEREALLADLGPTMVKRSLLVLANLAARLGDNDAADYARNLRNRIEVGRKTEAAS